MSTFIDRNALIRHLVPMVPGIIRDRFPNAKPDQNGWRLDDFSGDAGTSLSVSRTGDFYDFANSEIRGGVIDFYAIAFGLKREHNVLKVVAEHSGFVGADCAAHNPRRQELVERYIYHDEDGSETFQIGRFHNIDTSSEPERDPKTGKPKKQIRPITADGSSARLPLELKDNRPLYQQALIPHAELVILVEGERTADTLIARSFCATTWFGGAGCPPDQVNWSPLSGKRVVIWPDNDDGGRLHMEKVAASITSIAAEVRIIENPAEMPPKGDAVEAVELGFDIEQMIASAQAWKPGTKAKTGLFTDIDRPAPNLDPELFGMAAPAITKFADQMNCPVDYVVAPLLAASSAIVSKVVSVDINGSGWTLPVCVWTWSVGAPGAKKTPPAVPIMKTLDEVEEDWRERHERAIQSKIDDCLLQLADVELTDFGKKQIQNEIDDLEEEKKRPPRLKATDVTREMLASLEERAPRGLLLYSDELAGWLTQMNGYSGQSARTFYLQSYDGGIYTFDRVTAGRSGRIEKHLLAVHCGMQPDVLNESILKGIDDGLAARALLFWPGRVTAKPIVRGQPVSTEAIQTGLLKLLEIEPGDASNPNLLSLSDEALSALNEWRCGVQEPRLGNTGKQASAIAKLENQLLRLTGLLTLLDFAFSDAKAAPAEVSLNAMTRAITLVETYFMPQIERVYNDIDLSPEERMAREIIRTAKSLELEEFERGEVLRKLKPTGWRAKGAKDLRDAALELLVEYGIVSQHPVPGTQRVRYRLT
ncbi:MAG: DUF3987 domain-containing protein [Pseudomonadota bacterium]